MPPKSFLAALTFLLLAVSASRVSAQDSYPSRPIQLLVTTAAGGALDLVARAIADRLSETLQQPIVIENQPAANGSVGAGQFVHAPPDGHRLMMVVDSTVTINPSLYKNLAYDAFNDFAPVSLISRLALVLISNPNVKAADLRLRAMKIRKSIGASYSVLRNKIVLDYMSAAGFEALSMEPIDVPFDQVAQISVERLYSHIKGLFRKHKGADGIYIQGGDWQTMRVVQMLETDLQVPVVHATAANAWTIHKHLMVRETTPDYGRLLAELP